MSITEGLRQLTGMFLGSVLLAAVAYGLRRLLRCSDATPHFPNPKRSAYEAIAALFVFAAGITAGLAVFKIWRGKSPELFKEYEPWILIFPLFSFACAVVPVVLFMKRRKESLSTVGLGRTNLWQSLVIGSILVALAFLFSGLTPSSVAARFRPHHLVPLAYGFLIGSQEEFLFRGYIQTRIVAWRGRLFGLILTSLVFTYMHFGTYMLGRDMGLIDAFLQCTVMLPIGLLYGFTMLQTGNLASVLPAHMCAIFMTQLK